MERALRILCVIDSLGSGGAQRQMVHLISGLVARGHQVDLVIYHPHENFNRHRIDALGISVTEVVKGRGFSLKVPWAIARLLRQRRHDVAISFLPAPNIYCILGKLLSLRTVTVLVGERSSGRGKQGRTAAFAARLLYGNAHYVVANSISQANHLRCYLWIRDKVRCIYNGYSLKPVSPAVFAPNPILRLLVVGRISPEKNGLKLVQALSLFAQRHGFSPSVSWVGRQEMDTKSLALRADMDRLLAESPMVQCNWRWLGELDHVHDLLIEHDGLVLASLFEGLPNVVCEAFIAGRPAIISAVCDHPLLVGDDERGFLFDPASSESLCAAIERFVSLSPEQRHAMGLRARRYAEEHLTVDRMVDEYLSLVRREA